MNALYPLVAERAGHRCEYCQAPEVIFNLAFEVEHIVPTSQGGADDASNCALACRACNLFKSDPTSGVDPETKQVAPLFHPRRERWNDHFRVDPESGVILGRTGTGRATVTTLQMNRASQTEARSQWMRLGLFP